LIGKVFLVDYFVGPKVKFFWGGLGEDSDFESLFSLVLSLLDRVSKRFLLIRFLKLEICFPGKKETPS